jgi:hypothetical protein
LAPNLEEQADYKSQLPTYMQKPETVLVSGQKNEKGISGTGALACHYSKP